MTDDPIESSNIGRVGYISYISLIPTITNKSSQLNFGQILHYDRLLLYHNKRPEQFKEPFCFGASRSKSQGISHNTTFGCQAN